MKHHLPIFLLAFCLSLTFPAKALAQSAGFSWSQPNLSIPLNQSDSINLSLSTAGKLTTGVDVILNFDPTAINIEPIVAIEPNIYPVNFFLKIPSIDPSITTLRLTSSSRSISETFYSDTTSPFASLVINPLKQGTTTITFSCTPGSTTDTNIVQQQSQDIVDCSTLKPLSITITPPLVIPTDNNSQDTSDSNSDSDTELFSGLYFQPNTPCSLPAYPKNFTAKTVDPTSVLLTWTNDPTNTNYSLWYGTNPNFKNLGVSTLGKSSQFLVNFLKPNTTYYFSLSASNSCGVSSAASLSKKTASETEPIELKLEPDDIKTLTSTSNIITTPKPSDPNFDYQESTNQAHPQSLRVTASTSDNIWSQIVILFIPFILISFGVGLLFLIIKRRHRQTTNTLTLPQPTPPPIANPTPTPHSSTPALTQPTTPTPSTPTNPSELPPAFANNFDPFKDKNSRVFFNTNSAPTSIKLDPSTTPTTPKAPTSAPTPTNLTQNQEDLRLE